MYFQIFLNLSVRPWNWSMYFQIFHYETHSISICILFVSKCRTQVQVSLVKHEFLCHVRCVLSDVYLPEFRTAQNWSMYFQIFHYETHSISIFIFRLQVSNSSSSLTCSLLGWHGARHRIGRMSMVHFDTTVGLRRFWDLYSEKRGVEGTCFQKSTVAPR